MIHRLVRLALIPALAAGLAGPARAISQKVQLLEEPLAGNRVGYTLANPLNASVVFDITLFAVTLPKDPGPVDPLAPAGWSAQVLTEADWSLPIGGVAANPSWQRFTGAAFTSAFEASDTVLGYYVTFAADTSGKWTYLPQEPIKPGQSRAGFTRAGLAASDFLAFGPMDAATFVGDASGSGPIPGVAGVAGAATAVPEPPATALAVGGLAALLLLRRRGSQRAPGPPPAVRR